MTGNEFFEILGYLASPLRNTKLDIETHPRRRLTLEPQYELLTGDQLQEDNVNYYVWDEDANKWGAELRIYYNGNLTIMPTILSDLRRTARPGDGYENRINSKDLVWKLITYGFRVGNGQDESLVRSYVPEGYMEVFENGFNIT